MDLSKLLKGQKVLVIDDEKFSRSIIVRFFSEFGDFPTVAAENGAEGLLHLAQQGDAIGVVVCDFNMPAVNGLQVLKAVRTGFNGIRADIPVIMLTGHSDARLVGSAMALDVDAFLVKPVSKQTLVSRVAHALSGARTIKSPERCALVDIDIVTNALREEEAKKKRPASEKSKAVPAAPAPAEPVGKEVLLDAVVPPVTLARDICSPDGTLLLSAGNAITPRLLDRLRELSSLGIDRIWIEE